MVKQIIKFILALILIPVVWVAGNLIYGTVTDYQPDEMIEMKVLGENLDPIDSSLNIMIWNIGYGGLGKESDFFYDGGTTVRMDEPIVRKNVQGALRTITASDSIDVFLLQEVDTSASRSYGIDQYEMFGKNLPEYNSSFALNYNVGFVPIPLTEPMGKVQAGLATYSKMKPTECMRYQFPSSYSWPNRIYFLDRCCMLSRFPTSTGNDLVLINTHNSAYDDGSMKKAEMGYLKDLVISEYEKGNYVIVGGDWNQGPPEMKMDQFFPPNISSDQMGSTISSDFLPGWNWSFDSKVPTNRSLLKAFNPDSTRQQLIDFFLLSPNLMVESCKTIDQQFEFSDHQAVVMKVTLN